MSLEMPVGFRPEELDAFLGELIAGHSMSRAAAHTGGDGLALRRFARDCGFPNPAAMRKVRASLAGLVPTPVLLTTVVHAGKTRIETPSRAVKALG